MRRGPTKQLVTLSAVGGEVVRALSDLFRTDRERIGSLGRGAGSALRVHHELQRRPLATVGWLCGATNLTAPTVGKALEALVKLGVLREVTGRKRGRVFVYSRYLVLLGEETEAA